MKPSRPVSRKLSLSAVSVRSLTTTDLATIAGGRAPTGHVCETVRLTVSQAQSCELRCWTMGPRCRTI